MSTRKSARICARDNLTFEDLRELGKWANDQSASWSRIAAKLAGCLEDAGQNLAREQASYFKELSEKALAANREGRGVAQTKTVVEGLQSLREGVRWDRDTETYKKISKLADKDPEAAVGYLLLKSRDASAGSGRVGAPLSFLRAMIVAATDEFERERAEEQARRIEASLASAERGFSSLQERYKEALRFEAPAAYWRRKRRGHGAALGAASLGFALLTGILSYLVWLGWPEVQTFLLELVLNGVGLSLFAILAMPALLLIWPLWLLARVFARNLDFAMDASQRAAMLMTFRAMMFENGVTPEDRRAMLETILRWRGPGTNAEDQPSARATAGGGKKVS